MAGTVTATYKTIVGAVSKGSVKFTPLGVNRIVEGSGSETPGTNPAVEIVIPTPFVVVLVNGTFTKTVTPTVGFVYMVQEYIDGSIQTPFAITVEDGETVNLKDLPTITPGSGDNLPDFTIADAGFALRVNEDGTDVEWVADPPPPSTFVLLGAEEELPDPLVPGVLYLRLAIPSTPVVTLDGVPEDVSFVVDWTASTGFLSISGYETRINSGSPINAGNVLTYTYDGLTAETEYTVEVRAYDSDGVYSSWSDILTVTTAISGGGGTPPLITYTFNSGTSEDDGIDSHGISSITYDSGHLVVEGGGYSTLRFDASGAQVLNTHNAAIELDFTLPQTSNNGFTGVILNAEDASEGVGPNGLRVFFDGFNQWVVGNAPSYNAGDTVMTFVASPPASWSTLRVAYVDGVVSVTQEDTLVATFTMTPTQEAYRAGGSSGICGDSSLSWWDGIDTVRIYDLGAS